jgi:hypothetical protein
MIDFYKLTERNFGLKINFISEGVYKDSPEVVIYPYSTDEIKCDQCLKYTIRVNFFNNKFWFDCLFKTFFTTFDFDETQYMVFKLLKDIMKESKIEKDLLPELRYKIQNN